MLVGSFPFEHVLTVITFNGMTWIGVLTTTQVIYFVGSMTATKFWDLTTILGGKIRRVKRRLLRVTGKCPRHGTQIRILTKVQKIASW